MDVRLEREGERPELVISETGDRALFDELTRRLPAELAGDWVEQVDGLDQRYWDLRVGEAIVTLHLDHFAGIVLFPSSSSPSHRAAADLTERIARLLAG